MARPTDSDDDQFPTLPWPSHSAHIFKDGSLWALPHDTLEGWDLYARGYRRAAEALLAELRQTSSTYLLMPAAFLYRHHVELRLKHMLYASAEAHGPALPTNWKPNHSLIATWTLLRPRLIFAFHGISVAELDNVERLINELHEKDPGSFVFRYPATMLGSNHLTDADLDINSLNMSNYNETMSQLAELLDLLSDCMHEVAGP